MGDIFNKAARRAGQHAGRLWLKTILLAAPLLGLWLLAPGCASPPTQTVLDMKSVKYKVQRGLPVTQYEKWEYDEWIWEHDVEEGKRNMGMTSWPADSQSRPVATAPVPTMTRQQQLKAWKRWCEQHRSGYMAEKQGEDSWTAAEVEVYEKRLDDELRTYDPPILIEEDPNPPAGVLVPDPEPVGLVLDPPIAATNLTQALKAVVEVDVFKNGQTISSGSGFWIVSPKLRPPPYLIVTAKHIIISASANLGPVQFDNLISTKDSWGRSLQLNGMYSPFLSFCTGSDETLEKADAVIFVPPEETKPAFFLRMNLTDKHQVGEDVWVLAKPLLLPACVTKGIISAVEIMPHPRIQITAPVSHGSSGGAVVDSKLNVIGVVSSFATDGQNVNFADLLIPSSCFDP
ncbi:MAG: trypsin-like peptidase domain-containing protein [Lentisphaerae bacterium]|nr:trypsin-like peptidase domain-containing protein [Lentisphaerota bacterium]